jgi:hypothetical protein
LFRIESPSAQTSAVQLRPVVSTVIGVGPAVDVPVPVRLMICGLPAALSVSAMVPVRVPVALGLNWGVITQEAPGAIVMPMHWLLRSRKSIAFAPPCVSALKKTDEVPALVTVTVWAGLVVPTSWAGNVTAAVLMLMVGVLVGGGALVVVVLPPPPLVPPCEARAVPPPAARSTAKATAVAAARRTRNI